ncbi:hypothetical protein DFP72DRAFT_801516, partial [Ephemerocybe angulata]
PDYYVQAGTEDAQRIYYRLQQLPAYIHSATHVFIGTRTCDIFSSMMVNAWTSASNCSRIYNNSFSSARFAEALPLSHSKNLELDEGKGTLWNSMYLYWLLLDKLENSDEPTLRLKHDAPSQMDRLKPALHSRNERMAGTGQEAWNHACDMCCWVQKGDDGSTRLALRSVVVDGITIGRPCCSSHDCKKPLESVKDRFCAKHDVLNQCCEVDCVAQVEPGFRTCADSGHRALETYLCEANKAMFQLQLRLKRNGLAQPGEHDVNSDSDVEVDDEIDSEVCDGKPGRGNKTVKARFGRRRTHNEETCVGSCGVMLGRATFYGSEAPNGVREFLKGLFPTKASVPGVIWHDNNCKIQAMLKNDDDDTDRNHFAACAMPVDVFHFKSKHKETDEFCNQNCNALLWDELKTEDGNWRFNSSAAEQSNVWFGGFQALVREMEATRYDFFLDEMVKLRNRILIRELEKKGKAPYSIPRADLLS